jgi:hypothetical protein
MSQRTVHQGEENKKLTMMPPCVQMLPSTETLFKSLLQNGEV